MIVDILIPIVILLAFIVVYVCHKKGIDLPKFF